MPKMSVWPSSVMQLKHGANGTLLNFLSSTRVVPSTTSFELLRRCITSFAFVNDAIFISLYISDISWQYLEDCLKFCLAFVWPFFFFSVLFHSVWLLQAFFLFFLFHTLTKFLPHFNASQSLSPLCFHYSFPKKSSAFGGREGGKIILCLTKFMWSKVSALCKIYALCNRGVV